MREKIERLMSELDSRGVKQLNTHDLDPVHLTTIRRTT